MQALSKEAVEDAFREMGEILFRAGKVAEIAVYGAAILLQFAERLNAPPSDNAG